MKHTMKSVMQAVEAAKVLPVLTTNQCHALAQELNKNACVKLPERKSAVDTFSTYGLGKCAGWNECLDALGDALLGE